MEPKTKRNIKGTIFDIQRFTIHDGPGIRTLVFLKGCPLHCPWCCNPESIHSQPELGFIRARCTKCGKCIPACHEQALASDDSGLPFINRKQCTSCGLCTVACSPGALILYGKEVTAEYVLNEVLRDKLFYGKSGGITVSGGEELRQPSFVRALFELCHENGLTTCQETCGYASSRVFEELLPLTDYILFDLKHMDSTVHKKFTGVSNKLIIQNAKAAVRSVPVLFRTPVIPGINDSIENAEQTALFIKSLQGEDAAIQLMLYHRMGIGKYEALDRTYPLGGSETLLPDSDTVKSLQRVYENLRVRCSISI